MNEAKEKATDIAALNGKMDEMLFFLKHIHYTNVFGEQIKNKSVYYDDFTRKLEELRTVDYRQ